MEHKSKIALVTGGSRGLGKNMALKLAERGIDVILTYLSKEEEANEVVAQIKEAGQNAVALRLDTGDVKSFDSFFEQLKGVLQGKFHADKFDFLINNAGVGHNTLIKDMSEDVFDQLMNVHFKGVYFLTQKALELMNDQGGIVNVSTGLTRMSMFGYSAYASMKGAIEVFTRYLAAELGARGINVNSIAPGAIETDFGGGAVRDNEQINKHISGITALGRVGLPEDIGGVVAFLCTPDAKWITAQRIEVSGGMSL
ncbi:SDR family NAD(P)-dependent oxidoreductase [Pedobacter cryoconitis]|uniref:NAD(P)-dependent dehydrogenase (Short-subunit alcohol dehydrogenase family) n=1 Tax=Pedobacter cryoconitis TaxID=188932 RepID=A0A327SDX7_9SPHI|nr:SDR family oxidoreductase [Pedobacter cryoconitis]RAJ27269.1 NAD(P)-dependent dehydrogenase (short-subunit alcohol dehydrogenase family) [Pedobacter cryoconitis]